MNTTGMPPWAQDMSPDTLTLALARLPGVDHHTTAGSAPCQAGLADAEGRAEELTRDIDRYGGMQAWIRRQSLLAEQFFRDFSAAALKACGVHAVYLPPGSLPSYPDQGAIVVQAAQGCQRCIAWRMVRR